MVKSFCDLTTDPDVKVSDRVKIMEMILKILGETDLLDAKDIKTIESVIKLEL